MGLIFSPSVGEEQIVIFEKVFTLLDTCGRQETLIWDKHEDVREINIWNYIIKQEWRNFGFTYWYLIHIYIIHTYNTSLLMLASIIFLVAFTTYGSFKLIFLSKLNLVLNIIIIIIYQTNRMSLYGFFFNHVKNTFRGVFETYYSNNIKMWIKYFACWKYDSLLQWLLISTPISVFLHGSKILCLYK